MAASLASTSRVNAARLPQICGIAEGFLQISSLPSRNLSAKAAGKRPQIHYENRLFSTCKPRQSTWAAGVDVGASETTTSFEKRSAVLPPPERSVTVGGLLELKATGEPIAVLTAYDYASGLSLRSAPVDICLVGDSLANVALGYRSTQQISLEAMIHHTQAVARGLRHATLNQHNTPPIPLLLVDLPYGYAQGSIDKAIEAATALVQKGGANGIKIEGGIEILPLVHKLTAFGMPVMGHIGLQPQRASSSSAFQMQGKTANQAIDLLHTALMLQQAGAFGTVLECIPNRVGMEVSKRVKMFTIGIGAGKGCDGQVLVTDDMLGECTSPLHVLAGITKKGLNENDGPLPVPSETWPHPPRFARGFVRQITGGANLGAIRIAAVQAYVEAVKSRKFPSDEEGYKMKREEWAMFKGLLEDHDKEVIETIAMQD